MFESLSDKFDGIFTRLRGRGRLGEADVDEVLREIRLALLEADVNFKVVRGLLNRIREATIGADLSQSLSPAQQVIKIVHQELIESLGGDTLRITYASRPPTVVLLAGLQGGGKTTAAAKLARWFKQQGRNPCSSAPTCNGPRRSSSCASSAIRLESTSSASRPIRYPSRALASTKRAASGATSVIVDTAGRLAIDEEMMDEVRRISDAVEPHYTFLVIDAMTGQDAVTTAEAFHQTLALDGVILSKLDGDAPAARP